MIHVVVVAHALPGRRCGPYADVRVGLQVRRDVVGEVDADVPEARWDAEVRVDEGPDFRGPAVHGPRGERFLYLVWTGREGTAEPAMFRRAKLRLDAVPPDVLAEAVARGTLVGKLGLTDAEGMPLCASIRPPVIRWRAG